MDITHILVHDSASTFGDINLINKWHKRRGFGWPEPRSGIVIPCGYHWVILNGSRFSNADYDPHLDGLITPGRPVGEVGAHCKAQGMNRKSIGYCLIGDGDFSDKQIETLTSRILLDMERFNVPPENVLGHGEVDPGKRDPRINMDALRSEIGGNKYGRRKQDISKRIN